MLLIPALLTLALLVVARILYPRPEDLDAARPPIEARGLPRACWISRAWIRRISTWVPPSSSGD